MRLKELLWNKYCLYNFSRYIYLKIENEYNSIVELSGITLPQLRVLWIIKCFPGVSLGEIAQIGCWTSPTVTKMLRILMYKQLVEEEEHSNKRLYRLVVTEKGEKYININRQGGKGEFILYNLSKQFPVEEIKKAINIFKAITINEKNKIILSYIERINHKELKIDYNVFSEEERERLKIFIEFYNLLRIFILNVESIHRQLLIKINLTYPQLRALWIIEAFPGITSAQLSEIGFWSPSTANVIVRNLFAKELIYKEKSQFKNALYLYISRKGEELILEDFNLNQKNIAVLNNIGFDFQEELVGLNMLLANMNMAIGNKEVEAYVTKTFQVIEKRLIL